MKVMNRKTGKVYKVIKIDYMSSHPSSITEYTLEDGRTYTNGELWADFVQVPEMNITMPKQEDK